MRYEIVHWYALDEDVYTGDVVEVVARTVDVDGLFSGPEPVERERVVLRGCPPSFADLAGDYELEVCVGAAVQLWYLTGLVVHGTLPAGDRIDVVASAAVHLRRQGPAFGHRSRLILFQDDVFVGLCVEADGFPRQWDGHEWPSITLIGVDHPERLEPLELRKGMQSCGEQLRALDRHGRIMARVPIELDIASVTPSALGGFDVVLDQSFAENRPLPSVRAVWDLWREGIPAQRNLWAPFDADGRRAWGDLTYGASPKFETDEVGGVYQLDGRYITDEPGLHLAMSEAVLGPGHYFGRSYQAFKECLGGGWGVARGFTLVWNDAQVAHDSIREYFLLILKLLRHRNVTVELKSSSSLDGVKELDRRMALGALVNRWITGWAKVADPAREPQAGQVLTDEGETSWRATHIMDGDWITVPTTAPDEVTAILSGVGLKVRPRETFMRRSLTDHPAYDAPSGYAVEVKREDVVIEVRVLRNGTEAASGLIAVVGEDAVPHRIATTPEHRRRGLGSVVMGVLAREAVKDGAATGLLFASEDGLHLYRKLGWETVSDVVIAEGKP